MPFHGRWWLYFAICTALFGSSACKAFKSTCDEDDRSCLGGGLARSGEACVRTGDCASGMACRAGACQYDASTKRGGKCVVTAECVAGTYCSSELKCTTIEETAGAVGDACGDSSECQRNLVCDLDLANAMVAGPFAQLSNRCQDNVQDLKTSSSCELPKRCVERGKGDFNDKCKSNSDCMSGLYCAISPLDPDLALMCLGGVELPNELLTVPSWIGGFCPEDASTPTTYFELDAGYNLSSDFYRLPYPNDIRRDGIGIDLITHPSPPDELMPPVASRFVKDAATQYAFSTNPVVYFRFSTAYDSDTLSLSSVRIVDITPDSPGYNLNSTISWGPPERLSHYICPHWLSLHRPVGSPLRPNTTYAAIVTKTLKTKNGRDYDRGRDFAAMLTDKMPTNAATLIAWQAYAPLRAWLADPNAPFKANDLINAAVFTTNDPTSVVTQLKAAVAAEGGQSLKSLTACKDGVKSPCEEANGRGACHAESLDLTEIHGKISLPIFQTGTAPYLDPQDGGDVELDAEGKPRVQRREDVCFALSIPKRTTPPSGWPVVVYAYANGGVFQEAMGENGLAVDLAHADTPVAMLSFELPQHGARRGDTDRLPQDLFVNFQNPAALRGNVLQGAADLWSAIALAKVGILVGPIDGGPIRFDAKRIAMFAQGQGATHATLALAEDDVVRTVVLSGVPGHFSTAQLQRKKPASMNALLPLLLLDLDTEGNLTGGVVNPMLALIQSSVDSVDPLNYANRLFRITENSGRDVFVVYGRDDHFSPDLAQEAFAKGAKLQAVSPDLSMHFQDLDAPVTRNQTIGTDQRTVGLRQYDPETDVVTDAPEDGHYVVQATAAARADVVRFLTQALNGDPPSIGEAQ